MATHCNALARSLIRDDATGYCANHLEKIYDIWASLLDKTIFQPNEASNNLRLSVAFKELDEHIASPDLLKSRIGAVQLANLMVWLKARIKADRRVGRIAVKGRCDSVAIDAYVQARGLLSGKIARNQALHQVRMSKRWHILTGGSALRAILYGREAERIM